VDEAAAAAVTAAEEQLRKQARAVSAYIDQAFHRRESFAPFFPVEVFSEEALRWAL
jgi:hypothetical protein